MGEGPGRYVNLTRFPPHWDLVPTRHVEIAHVLFLLYSWTSAVLWWPTEVLLCYFVTGRNASQSVVIEAIIILTLTVHEFPLVGQPLETVSTSGGGSIMILLRPPPFQSFNHASLAIMNRCPLSLYFEQAFLSLSKNNMTFHFFYVVKRYHRQKIPSPPLSGGRMVSFILGTFQSCYF